MKEEIAIASDHAGYALKEVLKGELQQHGFQPLDLGTNDATTSVDYPDFGTKLADWVAQDAKRRGIVICGSGIGISIAANRNKKIRAALCTSAELARLSRQHNDANVLALGARIVSESTAKDCLKEFLSTPFEGGRHEGRVKKLSQC